MKMFIDTPPFIYTAESNTDTAKRSYGQIRRWIESDCALYLFVITLSEILIYPKKEKNFILANKYKLLFSEILSVSLLSIDIEAAEIASELRVKYKL